MVDKLGIDDIEAAAAIAEASAVSIAGGGWSVAPLAGAPSGP